MSNDANQQQAQTDLGATVTKLQDCVQQLEHVIADFQSYNSSVILADLQSALAAVQNATAVLTKDNQVVGDFAQI